jgi:hypothetical protein
MVLLVAGVVRSRRTHDGRRRPAGTTTLLLAAATLFLVGTVAVAAQQQQPPGAAHHDAALLQAGQHTQAHARASLHAGEHASASRFQSMADRVGIAVQPQRAARRNEQSRQHEHEQQIMLGVVEKVLNSPEQAHLHSDRDGSHAEKMEEEFHLLNALMEKQSEMREYGKDSNERESISGMSRKYLQQISDKAIKKSVSTSANKFLGCDSDW